MYRTDLYSGRSEVYAGSDMKSTPLTGMIFLTMCSPESDIDFR